MALYSTLASLSQTAASNSADGSVDAPSTIDQQTNLLASFAARLRDGDVNTPAATVASASTVVLDGVASTVNISGTTTINAVTLAEGSQKLVRFSGALTLTNGASLLLPGTANITTAAGDFAVFTGRASGVVACTNYQVASIPPVGASVLFAPGYYKIPGGFIAQWGSTVQTLNGGGGGSVTFPIAFPSLLFTVIVANGDNAATTAVCNVNGFNTSGFGVVFPGAGAVSSRANWIAVGI